MEQKLFWINSKPGLYCNLTFPFPATFWVIFNNIFRLQKQANNVTQIVDGTLV